MITKRTATAASLLMSLSLLGTVAGCGSTASSAKTNTGGSASSGKTLTVGYIDDFTGPLGIYGKQDFNGAKLAVQQFNASGGLNGTKIKLVSADAKTSQSEAVTQMRNMIYNQHIKFIMNGLDSAECVAMGKLAAQTKTVFTSFCGADNFVVKDGNPWSFRIVNMGAKTQSYSAAAYAHQHFPNKKRWYLIANDYSFGRQAVSIFEQRMKQLEPDVQFVGTSYVPLNATDYTPYITAILQKHPDAIFDAWANGIPFWKQAAPYHLSQKIQIVGGYWGGTNELAFLSKSEVPVGAIVGGIPWYGIHNKANTTFVNDFKSAFGKYPQSSNYFAYMSAEGLLQAMKKANSTDPAKVRQALSTLTMNTPIGKLTMDPWDNQGVAPYFLGVVSWDAKANQGRDINIVPVNTTSFMPTKAQVAASRKS